MVADTGNTGAQARPSPLREIVQPFVDAARAPRPLWGNNLQYFMEGFLYFGILNYLVIFCVENIGTNEIQAGWVVTILGGWLLSFLGPARQAIGIGGLYWVFAGLTLVALVITAIILDKRTMTDAIATARKERGEKPLSLEPKAKPSGPRPPLSKRVRQWLREHPMADPRFSFFIFVLIPVQTLFAHQYLTMPMYVKRTFDGSWLGANFEVAVNFNPLLIFILVPIVAALTRKTSIYRLMVVGTTIMAAPTFLLVFEPSVPLLFSYIVLMTFGEAIWQPRFLQYVAETAPEGKMGAYLGVARLPWFLTKMITGLYAGWFMMKYIPEGGVMNPGGMWFWHGIVAIITPILLVLAGRWMKKGFIE